MGPLSVSVALPTLKGIKGHFGLLESASSTRDRPEFSGKLCAEQLRGSVGELHMHNAYRVSLFLC